MYAWQTWLAAFSLRSSLDEGIYLLKGYLMASGVYAPYQPYGLWMNKMPLSFLIPGWVQAIFEPGLRTGRYYAIILSLLILAGTWFAAYRLSGKKVALIIVWLMAVNPAGIKLFSQAISQGLVAAMLIWSLVFLLGEGRKIGEIIAGSVLAGLIVMTRENMVPIMPFFFLLVFWQYGKKKGLISLSVMTVVFILGHAVFFPDILQNWAKWIPQTLSPFLDAWRIRPMEDPVYYETSNWYSNLFILLQGLRWHFVATAGVIIAWLFTPLTQLRKNKPVSRIAVVLSLLFVVLIAMHTWASIGKNYCTYCFPGYLAFFSPIGIVILAALMPMMSFQVGSMKKIVSIFLVVILTPLIGYGSYQDLMRSSIYPQLREFFFNLPLFWPRSGRLTFGEVTLWQLLSNKFGLSFEVVRLQVLPILIPVLLGFSLVVVLFIITLLIHSFQGNSGKYRNFANIFLSISLVISILVIPSKIIGGGAYTYDCGTGVVDAIEKAGMRLRAEIPTGAKIDWRPVQTSPVLLLYLDQPQIFPPQINGIYSFINGGDADSLARYGLWNQELSDNWLEQADYVLVEPPISAQFEQKLRSYEITELQPFSPLFVCGSDRFELEIFKKIR